MAKLNDKLGTMAKKLGEGAKNAQLLQGALRAIPRGSSTSGGALGDSRSGSRASSIDVADLVSRLLGGIRGELGGSLPIKLRREGL